ncbi:geranylgeranyl transferase type-2 subunit alpha 1-like [Aristolochia californica]|uniref:geranylgeranyl transferase type-2 subunit alpha 1-like n=1 Tax=Aristolochia californica TaxID=171875 RepID=UPI0035D5B9D2
MHGRPRKPPNPESADSIAKATELANIQSQLLFNHQNKIYDKQALDISSKLLEINPEIYTAWNYRKLVVENRLQPLTDSDSIKAILDEELKVVESSLRRNPKCYGAWHHRKWVLSKGFSSINNEFLLLDKLLKLDSRNFHGWNYRRFVAALKNVPAEEELKFTTEKIDANFSNYSAWHNRCVLLSNLLREKAKGFYPREKVLMEEYDLIHQAIFTDPDDQSGWFYHLWLLDQTVTPEAPFLISSFPAHGSVLHLFTTSIMEGALPLILYFNQPVGGVNLSTVTVKSELSICDDLMWKAISTNKSGLARAWLTYLKIPDMKSYPSKVYPVEIVIGHAVGIVSSNGFHCGYPSQLEFSLNLQDHSVVCGEKSEGEVVVWKEENFYIEKDILKNLLFFGVSFETTKIHKEHHAMVSKWNIEAIENDINLFRELLSEMDCKIGKLTLARLLMALDELMVLSNDRRSHSKEILELYNDLMKLDPVRSRYYMDERSLLILEQVTSSRESLVQHCSYYKESKPTSSSGNICLHLSKLSITRLGFVERLLWVQMLDLSHNELQSIEGLEVMQLLTRLNLSNNKICSFSALEPLRLIKSLRVLDISYNEIGLHHIDTARYLCSSPFSHSTEANQKLEEYVSVDIEASDYWEAIWMMEDLNLTQLDVVGNAINMEHFGKLALKAIPTLKWLDDMYIR